MNIFVVVYMFMFIMLSIVCLDRMMITPPQNNYRFDARDFYVHELYPHDIPSDIIKVANNRNIFIQLPTIWNRGTEDICNMIGDIKSLAGEQQLLST